MASRNAAGAAAAIAAGAPRNVEQLGGRLNRKNIKRAGKRQAPRQPASVYAGRERIGHVEPCKHGGYAALDADGRRLGQFPDFDDALAAVSALDRGVRR